MAQLGRFYAVFQDSNGNARVGSSINIYREGASVNGVQSGTSPLAVVVRHAGKIATGDTVFINGLTGTTYSATRTSSTVITLSGFAGTLVLANGDRLVPSNNQPTIYADDQGGATVSQPLLTGANGTISQWIEFGAYEHTDTPAGSLTTTLYQSIVSPSQSPGQMRYADEFGSIQLAINDLPSTGGTVRLSANTTYTVTAAITVPDDVELVGGGYSTIVKKNVGSSIGCIVNSGANGLGTGTQNNRITLRNFKVLGEASATTNYAIRMENVDNFRVENVWCQDILNGDSAAIDIDSCQHFFVRGCHINNCTNNGIKVRCQAEASTDFVISDNVVDTTAAQNGIFVANGTSFAATRFAITGNTIKSSGDVGIEVGNTNASAHSAFTVSGNTIISSSGDGITLRNCNTGTITGNTVALGGNADASGGISLYASQVDVTDLVITGNGVFGRVKGAGIRVGIASTFRPRRLTITGNHIRQGTGSWSGIDFEGYAEDSTISGNTVSNSQRIGIELNGSSASSRPIQRCIITGNNVFGNTVHGISVSNPLDNIITGNRLYNNGGWGINISDAPARNQIFGNDFDTNTSGSITGFTVGTLAGATPDVSRGESFDVTNGGAVTITAFNGGHEGKKIYLRFTDANTTVTDGGTIFLSGAGNFVSTADDTMVLEKRGANWYELSRSVN